MTAPVIRNNKPRSVIVAVWLIYSSAFLAGVFLVLSMLNNTFYNSPAPIEFLPDIITVFVIAVLAYFIASGRRLARLSYIVLTFVMYVLVFGAFYLIGFSNINVFNIPTLIQGIMQLLALVLLITPSANAWFKRENIKTTEPDDGKPI